MAYGSKPLECEQHFYSHEGRVISQDILLPGPQNMWKGSLEPWCIKDGQWVFWRWAIVSLRLFGKCTCLAFFVSTEVIRFSA